MKEMCKILPIGSCPVCGHKQFLVNEIETTNYLTDMNGEIVSAKVMNQDASGICCNCNAIFRMLPTSYGFIPLTNLRSILIDSMKLDYDDNPFIDDTINNPMEANKNDVKKRR